MPRRPMPWFRFYTEAPTDRKVRRLRRPDHKWVWVCAMCLARSSPVPGSLMISETEPVNVDDLADLADVPISRVAAALDAMAAVGLVEFDDVAGCWTIPSWATRQFASDTSTDRVRAHRQRTGRNDDETLQTRSTGRYRNAPETETETEQRVVNPSTGSDAWNDPQPVDNPGPLPAPDRGSELWARRTIRLAGDDLALTDDQARVELLHLAADHPDLTDDQLVARLRARHPA